MGAVSLADIAAWGKAEMLETSSAYVSADLASWQVYFVVPYFSLVSAVA